MEPVDRIWLAWSDDGTLERKAVKLACRSNSLELDALLELLRRRGNLAVVGSPSPSQSRSRFLSDESTNNNPELE